MTVLAGSEWRIAASRHTARVDAELADVVARRQRGQKHPVDDFLFQYYNLRPNQLRSWHAGIGIRLEDADEFTNRRFHQVEEGVAAFDAPAFLERRRHPSTAGGHSSASTTLWLLRHA